MCWLIYKVLEIVGFSLKNIALTVGAFLLFWIVFLGFRFVVWMLPQAAAWMLRPLWRIFATWRARSLDRSMPAVERELKIALHREMCLLATLMDRFSSELFLEKELPPDIRVVTRRVLLDRLRDIGLRDELDGPFLDILLAPDGHWTVEQKSRARHAVECFSVLRWVLGLGELRGLTVDPKYDLRTTAAVLAVREPERLLVRPSWDLRLARDSTDLFLTRCWIELLARKAVMAFSEEDVEKAIRALTLIKEEGSQHDYLVGTHTISEIETPGVGFLFNRALVRFRLLSLLVEINAGREPVHELRAFVAQIFSPSPEPREA